MRKIKNLFKKIVIGLTINLLVVIYLILNLWQFIMSFISLVLNNIYIIFVIILGALSFLFLIYCIFTPDINSIGVKIFMIVLCLIIVGLFIRFLNFLITIVNLVFNLMLKFLNAKKAIEVLRNLIVLWISRYIECTDSDIKTIERIYVFGTCYLLDFIRKILKVTSKVISVLIYPFLSIISGCFGFWLVFIASSTPKLWSLDWWLNICIIGVFVGIGAYLAYLISETVALSIETTEYDLFSIFRIYINSFKIFENSSYKHSEDNFVIKPDEKTNEFFVILNKYDSIDNLKKAYKKLAKEFHPDVSNHPADIACKKMADLNTAYEYFQTKIKNNK